MNRLPLAIIGCGGMGGRHLLGLKELLDSGLNNVELAAVCDLRRDNAERLAEAAEVNLMEEEIAKLALTGNAVALGFRRPRSRRYGSGPSNE